MLLAGISVYTNNARSAEKQAKPSQPQCCRSNLIRQDVRERPRSRCSTILPTKQTNAHGPDVVTEPECAPSDLFIAKHVHKSNSMQHFHLLHHAADWLHTHTHHWKVYYWIQFHIEHWERKCVWACACVGGCVGCVWPLFKLVLAIWLLCSVTQASSAQY